MLEDLLDQCEYAFRECSLEDYWKIYYELEKLDI